MRFNREAFDSLLTRELALRGESATEFAKRAGISAGALSDVRNLVKDTGKPRRQPSAAMVKQLAEALDVPIGALISQASVQVAS